MSFDSGDRRSVRTPFRAALRVVFAAFLLLGCEDDPILEPTGDDSGGGSYGRMSPLSAGRTAEIGRTNPETF